MVLSTQYYRQLLDAIHTHTKKICSLSLALRIHWLYTLQICRIQGYPDMIQNWWCRPYYGEWNTTLLVLIPKLSWLLRFHIWIKLICFQFIRIWLDRMHLFLRNNYAIIMIMNVVPLPLDIKWHERGWHTVYINQLIIQSINPVPVFVVIEAFAIILIKSLSLGNQ